MVENCTGWSQVIQILPPFIFFKTRKTDSKYIWEMSIINLKVSASVSVTQVTGWGFQRLKVPAMSRMVVQAVSCLLHTGLLLGLLFDPEDGGNMFLGNVGRLSLDYLAQYPSRHNSSQSLLREYQIQQVHRGLWLFSVYSVKCNLSIYNNSGTINNITVR
jgi:hypothetical protein